MYIKNSYDYLYSRSKSTVQYCTVLVQYSPIVTGRFLTTITSRPVLAWKKTLFIGHPVSYCDLQLFSNDAGESRSNHSVCKIM